MIKILYHVFIKEILAVSKKIKNISSLAILDKLVLLYWSNRIWKLVIRLPTFAKIDLERGRNSGIIIQSLTVHVVSLVNCFDTLSWYVWWLLLGCPKQSRITIFQSKHSRLHIELGETNFWDFRKFLKFAQNSVSLKSLHVPCFEFDDFSFYLNKIEKI